MKKVYNKPEIMFEHLDFDHAISACDYMLTADCQDVRPEDAVPDIPFKMENTIDGGINLLIYQEFIESGVCDSTHGCYGIPSLSDMTAVSLS